MTAWAAHRRPPEPVLEGSVSLSATPLTLSSAASPESRRDEIPEPDRVREKRLGRLDLFAGGAGPSEDPGLSYKNGSGADRQPGARRRTAILGLALMLALSAGGACGPAKGVDSQQLNTARRRRCPCCPASARPRRPPSCFIEGGAHFGPSTSWSPWIQALGGKTVRRLRPHLAVAGPTTATAAQAMPTVLGPSAVLWPAPPVHPTPVTRRLPPWLSYLRLPPDWRRPPRRTPPLPPPASVRAELSRRRLLLGLARQRARWEQRLGGRRLQRHQERTAPASVVADDGPRRVIAGQRRPNDMVEQQSRRIKTVVGDDPGSPTSPLSRKTGAVRFRGI